MNARLHELVCVFIFAEIKMYTIGLHEHFMYCVQYNKNRFGDLPWNQANAYPVNNIESKTREPTKTQNMLNTTYSPHLYIMIAPIKFVSMFPFRKLFTTTNRYSDGCVRFSV